MNGQVITLVPFAKSVGGLGINAGQGQFQPTNQIVDFYVDTLGPTSGSFRVNFEDVEQGADHDMDAIVRYTYTVTGSTVSVTVDSDYAAPAASCITWGTSCPARLPTAPTSSCGTAIPRRDRIRTISSIPLRLCRYPPAPAAAWDDNTALPLANTRTFSPGGGAAATLLNPLWYAAKWGGFKETPDDANDLPDIAAEWDANGDGNPDNYFLVTNALTLGAQRADAFDEILARTGSASSASVNSGSISTMPPPSTRRSSTAATGPASSCPSPSTPTARWIPRRSGKPRTDTGAPQPEDHYGQQQWHDRRALPVGQPGYHPAGPASAQRPQPTGGCG